MARAPNPKLDKALSLYQKGYKLIDIAKELDIPDGTVRRWKKTYNWDNERSNEKKNNSERSEKKKNKENAKKKLKEEKFKDEVREVLKNTNLTEKQKLFCIYYIEHFNATKAYQKAYGCSYDTARVNASKLLTNTNIKKEIQRLTKQCLEEEEIEAKLINKRLFEMYLKIAFADIGDYLEFGQEEIEVMGAFGPLKDEDDNPITKIVNTVKFKSSDDVDSSIISEVKQGKDGASIKLLDKMKALQWLDEHYGEGTTEQKLKISKLKAEVNKLENGDKDKPIEIMIKRKERD